MFFVIADINECLQGIDDCAKNNAATCINTFGSFQCVCKSGYSGDGRTCVGEWSFIRTQIQLNWTMVV